MQVTPFMMGRIAQWPSDIRTHAGLLWHVSALLTDMKRDLDPQHGSGVTSASPYETAWVALVHDRDAPDRLAFPEALAWLLRAQERDGSWGEPYPWSVLPTMAALLALVRAGPARGAKRAARRARHYLDRALPRWASESADTPQIELLMLNALDELTEAGVVLTLPGEAELRARRAEALDRLPLGDLYAGNSTLIHALEALGKQVDYDRLSSLRAGGGYGYSPAATAAVLSRAQTWDTEAAAWVRKMADRYRGAMPASFPLDVFECAWVLHYLWHGHCAPRPHEHVPTRAALLWLRESLSDEGARFSRVAGLPRDVDDTAMAIAVLNRYGAHAAPASLEHFTRDGRYVSFVTESSASPSVNAHALDALLSVDSLAMSEDGGIRESVVSYLLDAQQNDGGWVDKWHVSPYYATHSVVSALVQLRGQHIGERLARAMRWLVSTTHHDGGWGMRGSSLEETAYALLSLHALHRRLENRDVVSSQRYRNLMQRGRQWLLAHFSQLTLSARLPRMWVDKDLYAPTRVIYAAVLAALHVTWLAVEA
jgi:halimadienyl-diphosphate synthase